MRFLRVWREMAGTEKFVFGCAVSIILFKILLFVSVAYIAYHFMMKVW